MLSIISEIESIADCCLGAGKILQRKQQSGIDFNEEIYDNIDLMFDGVQKAMNNALLLLKDMENNSTDDIIKSYNYEREINNLRNTLRTTNIANINSRHYEYQAGIFYMDLVSNIEKTGDYIINVVDSIKEHFHRNKDR